MEKDVVGVESEIEELTKSIKEKKAFSNKTNVYNLSNYNTESDFDAKINELKANSERLSKGVSYLDKQSAYAQKKEADAAIDYLEAAKKNFQTQNNINSKYEQYRTASDFAELSKTINYPISSVAKSIANGTGDSVFMDKDGNEKSMYTYLHNKFGQDKAKEYWDTIAPFVNQREAAKQQEDAKEFAEQWGVGASIVSLGSNLIDGIVMAPAKLIGSLTGDYEKNWADYDKITNLTSGIRQTRGEWWDSALGTEDSDIGSFVYQTIMSIGDMGVALLAGKGVGAIAGAAGSAAGVANVATKTTQIVKGVTQFIMSSEAASNAMTSAREQGLTGLQITGMGVASAAIEALTEKYSLDALLDKPIKSAWLHIGKNILTEGSEEAVSNVLNVLADEVIAGNQSKIKQEIASLMANGASYEDAAQEVLLGKLKELGLDALGGALSGGIMGGGSAVIDYKTSVHYSIPKSKNTDLETAKAWVSEKFESQKGGVEKKGVGTITLDIDSTRDAIQKTKNADQAVAFAAINDIIRKGEVVWGDESKTAGFVTALASLNGQKHPTFVTFQKTETGNFLVTGLKVDGDMVYDASEYVKQADSATEKYSANSTGDGTEKEHISIEDFTNRESSVWNNVDYKDERRKTAIMREVHEKMVRDGNIVVVSESVSENVEKAFPDLRDVKKKERIPRLKEAINKLKDDLKRFLSELKKNEYEFEVNGKILDAKLYNTGVQEIMESITREKANMLYTTREVFQNARYLYSTMDYDGDPNIYRWNYFYTPVQIGEEVVGVRIAIRDMANPAESQIYHWRIKKEASLGGVGRGENPRISYDASSEASDNRVAQNVPVVNTQYMQNATDNTYDYSVLRLKQTDFDRTFAKMSETERTSFIQMFEQTTGTRVVFDDTLDVGGSYKDGVITINPNGDTLMIVLKHELTHHLEQSGSYADFMNTVFASETFKTWLSEKRVTLPLLVETVIDYRKRKKKPLGQNGVKPEYAAKQEILADFVGEKLLRDQAAIAELAQKNRGIIERIRDWFANLVSRFRDTPAERELRKMEQLFAKALRQADGKTKNDAVKFSFGVTQADIDEYVDKAYIKENSQDHKEYALVSDRLIADTQGELDLTHYAHALRDNDIRHIKNSHGDGNLTEKYPVTREDLKRIPYIVENYDKVFVKRNAKGVPGLVYVKVSQNNVVYYVEAVTEEYHGKKLLVNKQMVKTGIDAIPNLYGLIDAINKKESSDQYLADLKEIRKAYVQDVKGNYSSNDIEPQFGTTVNTQYMQNGAKNSVSPVAEEISAPQTPAYTEEPDFDSRPIGSMSAEEIQEYLSRLDPKRNPITIAQAKMEDANTTKDDVPNVVRNRRGDGDSAFAANLQGSTIFDDEFKGKAITKEEILHYDRIANDETMDAAVEEVNNGGAEYALDWMNKDSSTFTAKDIAAGFVLMYRYQQEGKYQSECNIAAKLREAGTSTAQALQTFSILGRMTPEGMVMYAQRELNQAYNEMIKNRSIEWADAHRSEFNLTAEDIEYIQTRTIQASLLPDGRDRNVLLAEICSRVQSKIPQKRGQAFKALQRTAMLLNPKTQLRNFLGNAFMMPQHIVSDLFGTVIDKAISKSTGTRTTSSTYLSKTGVKEGAKAFKQGFFESWDDFVRHINTRQNFGDGKFEIDGQSLDNFNENHTGKLAGARNQMSKALNALDRLNSFLLDAGDRSFYQMWFINSLNGQMKANNVTDPSAEMIEIATADALQRTFQDNNKMTELVTRLKNAGNVISVNGYGVGDLIIKFAKTPANITKAMIDFSPAGFLKAISHDAYRFADAVKHGKVTPQMQRNFVKNLSNGITGTIMTAVAVAIAKAGLATGKKDKDKDVAAFEKDVLGEQSYSVKIGNMSFTYDWMQPSAAMLAVAADYFEDVENEELTGQKKEWQEKILDGIRTAGDVLYNQSFMTSIQSLFSDDGFISGFINAVLSDPSTLVPQVFSQTANIFDDTKRNTYESGDSVGTAWSKVLYKLPGARNELAESVDVLGNTKKQYGNAAQRALTSFFSAPNVAQGYDSKAGDEMYRLYQATGDATVIPTQAPNSITKNTGKYTLSSYEKADYQKSIGKAAVEAVEGLLGNEQYAALDDKTKIKVITAVYSYSRQVANKDVLGIELDEDTQKKYDVISQGVPAYEYFLLKKTADQDENESISQDEAKAILDASDLTRKQKEIMWSAFNSRWKSNPYRQRYY